MVTRYVTQPFVGPLSIDQIERIKKKLLKEHNDRVWLHRHDVVLQDMINDFIKIQGGRI